jgi:hypothetical protein
LKKFEEDKHLYSAAKVCNDQINWTYGFKLPEYKDDDKDNDLRYVKVHDHNSIRYQDGPEGKIYQVDFNGM